MNVYRAVLRVNYFLLLFSTLYRESKPRQKNPSNHFPFKWLGVNQAAKAHDLPALKAIATSTSNVYPETSLVGQLQAGQLDAGFFYGVEAAAADIKTVPLSGTKLAGVYTITILNRAPHEAAARAFVAFLLGKDGHSILAKNGIVAITPPKVSGKSSVPKDLKGLLSQ